VKRFNPEIKHDAELYKLIGVSKVWKSVSEEPLLSQAKLLMILPLLVPIRLEGETDIEVDGSWYTLVEDEPVELDMTEGDEGAKIELDAARATGFSSAPVYAPLPFGQNPMLKIL